MAQAADKQAPTREADQQAERLVQNYFCRLADTIGLPRSLAQIYAVLFLAPEPLSFAEIVETSGLSKGSASTGLRHLKRIRGVEVILRPPDRRTYYRPETSPRRLAGGFLAEAVEPGLAEGERLLDQATAAAAASNGASSDHLRSRIDSLTTWHQRAGELLPMLNALSSG